MKKDTTYIHEEFVKEMLPHVNFQDFDLVDMVLLENVWRWARIYEKRYWITIEEKPIPPDDSWNWYAHGFEKKEIDDWPIRAKACTLIIKRRRRKNRITNTIVNSTKQWVELLPWTLKPEDILTFLK